MFRTALVAAFVAAASAASWPMITVNSAGNIVLNSPTKAGSFQLNAVSVTSAPTTSSTASRTTVTALDSDTDAFIVNVPSSPATSAGFKLPTATEGRTIRFYNSGSGAGAFTIWTSSTSVFFDGTSETTKDILSTTSYVVCVATSSTNWVVSQNNLASDGIINKEYRLAASVTLSSNAATLTAAQVAGGILTVTPTAATTITTPTATSMTAFDSNSANGDSYEFSITNSGSIATGSPTTDLLVTLSAGTGFTIPTDTRAYVAPGQTRNYIAYRSSSSAWVVIQKSQYTIMPSTIVTGTNTAQTASATVNNAALTNSVHGIKFKPLAAGVAITLVADVAAFVQVTNNYAKLGDSCQYYGSDIAGDITVGAAALTCQVTADNTVNIFGAADTAAVIEDPVFEILKN